MTSGPLSRGFSQQDLLRQSFVGHSGHMAEPTYICNKILLDYLALLIGMWHEIFYFVLPCTLRQEYKFANSLKCNKKVYLFNAFQMLGTKVTFKKIKQSIASDASKDAKLIENHINIYLPISPHATTTLDYI